MSLIDTALWDSEHYIKNKIFPKGITLVFSLKVHHALKCIIIFRQQINVRWAHEHVQSGNILIELKDSSAKIQKVWMQQ